MSLVVRQGASLARKRKLRSSVRALQRSVGQVYAAHRERQAASLTFRGLLFIFEGYRRSYESIAIG